MTATALVAAMLELAGPDCHATCKLRARALAPVILMAHRQERATHDPIETARRAFAEGSFRAWPPTGDHGEVGAMHVLPATGDWLCKNLDWRHHVSDNVRCGVRIMKWYDRRCHNVQVAYTGATCHRRAIAPARR
jgi:hypothetical protein